MSQEKRGMRVGPEKIVRLVNELFGSYGITPTELFLKAYAEDLKHLSESELVLGIREAKRESPKHVPSAELICQLSGNRDLDEDYPRL